MGRRRRRLGIWPRTSQGKHAESVNNEIPRLDGVFVRPIRSFARSNAPFARPKRSFARSNDRFARTNWSFARSNVPFAHTNGHSLVRMNPFASRRNLRRA